MFDILQELLTHKQRDERFAFIAEIASSNRGKDGVLDACYNEGKPKEIISHQSDYFYKGIPIGRMRDAMNCENKDASKGIIEESILHVPFSDHMITMVMYKPFHANEILPCIVYFHGGAYMGGSIKVTANICRALADEFHAVVFNVDYRLAPEHPYPRSSDDCYGCFNWICDHAMQYGIDEKAIYVAGDSAGGNFAINCCIREHELNIHRIHGAILYYPHVIMMETKEYPWDLSMYDIQDDDKVEIMRDIIGLKEVIRMADFYYLQGAVKKEDALVSPLLYEHMEGLPPMMIVTAEFDYLRVQQEYFANRLHEANVTEQLLQYQGMQHAFMDHIGTYPQAQAAIQETIAFLRNIYKEK